MGSEYSKQDNFNVALKYFAQSVQICSDCNDNIQFDDDTYGFELTRKSQIATCNFCGDDDEALFYYTKALKIYRSSTKLKAICDIESTCTSKINSIFQSNFPSDQLIEDIPRLLEIKKSKKRIEEEEDLFRRNYFNESKENQLAKLYSHIGNTYTKMKKYKEAKLYYDKSIKYYETFPLLFHLVIADLYSRQGFIIDAQQPADTGYVTSCTEAEELFDKAIATIYNNDNSLS
ncbi:unnamed protein product [Adineta steineri]|uniref:Tetratricopeptide repeat protein n=1 Tax=Adineta steineri TaxID=433720 RepID=A0A814SLE7_9BILA|nr:unnamed protein product [Adineta steineri]CAF1473802.1 unnamed protein product [Adineta steineri]